MAGFSFAKWRQVMSAAIAFSLFTIPVISPPAHAAAAIYQKLGADNYDPAGEVRYDHESRSMLVRIFDDNKDLVVVTLGFASNVSSTTFSSSNTLLRIKFMPSLTNFKGNAGNVWIESPKAPYQGATKIPENVLIFPTLSGPSLKSKLIFTTAQPLRMFDTPQ